MSAVEGAEGSIIGLRSRGVVIALNSTCVELLLKPVSDRLAVSLDIRDRVLCVALRTGRTEDAHYPLHECRTIWSDRARPVCTTRYRHGGSC